MQRLNQQIGWYKRAQWTLGLAILLALAGFYVAVYRPATGRLDALLLQIQSRRRELEQNQNRARNLPILALEVQRLESRVQLYDRQLPRQPELGQFIRDLTRISQRLALQDLKLEPAAPRRGNGFSEQPIVIHLSGDFLNVASFLRQIEDLPRLTRIQRLNIKSKTGHNGAVTVEMTMSVFFGEV